MEPISGNVFAAEYILKDRTKRGKIEYLIKWKGWNSRWNSWEPAENILDPRLLDEYTERKSKPQTRGKRRRPAKQTSTTSGSRPKRKAAQKGSVVESSDEEKEEEQPGTSKEKSESPQPEEEAPETTGEAEESKGESVVDSVAEEGAEKTQESHDINTETETGNKEKLTQIVEPLKHAEEQVEQPAAPPAPAAPAAAEQDEQSSSSSSSDDSDSDESDDEAQKRESMGQNETEIQAQGDADSNNVPQDLTAPHRVQEYPLPGTPSPPHLSPLEAEKTPGPPAAAQVHPAAPGPEIAIPSSAACAASDLSPGSATELTGMRKVVCSPQELQFPNHNSQLVTTVEGVTIVENLRTNP